MSTVLHRTNRFTRDCRRSIGTMPQEAASIDDALRHPYVLAVRTGSKVHSLGRLSASQHLSPLARSGRHRRCRYKRSQLTSASRNWPLPLSESVH